jgi:hypothetical protein
MALCYSFSKQAQASNAVPVFPQQAILQKLQLKPSQYSSHGNSGQISIGGGIGTGIGSSVGDGSGRSTASITLMIPLDAGILIDFDFTGYEGD